MIKNEFNIQIDNSFTETLPADKIKENYVRQVSEAAYSFVEPKKPSNPKLLIFSKELAETLGFQQNFIKSESFIKMFSGADILEGTSPYAMAYGGHQFGHWAGQLGDGRAINLFELIHHNQRWALQLKGSGLTPYSRNADGLAVLRSSIREFLCSEAMFHLGVPTTRALSLCLSGNEVLRDMFYNGNPGYEKGAIVCRVAPSFIRFGNFQLFIARNDIKNLQQLTDYTIKNFYPEIKSEGKEKYLSFFEQISKRTLDMVIHWERVGFVHGVMNTDNLSILGLTIDYGPYGWIDDYDETWTPNTTDAQNRRYRFGNQANICLWNLAQLANALYPLVEEDKEALINVLNDFKANHQKQYIEMMCHKIGLYTSQTDDENLIHQLTHLLQLVETDMTIFYRNLALIVKSDNLNVITIFQDAFYQPEKITDEIKQQWENWFELYIVRLQKEKQSDKERREHMNKINPKYVLRNYMAQMAIDKADEGDYTLLHELHELLKRPYDEQPENEKWFAKRPDWARSKPGCSMLSCSS